MQRLTRVWRGEERLFITFWYWLVLGNLLYGAVLTLVVRDSPLPLLAKVIVGWLGIAYTAFTGIATWRAAAKEDGYWLWEILARLSVVALAIFLLFSLFTG